MIEFYKPREFPYGGADHEVRSWMAELANHINALQWRVVALERALAARGIVPKTGAELRRHDDPQHLQG